MTDMTKHLRSKRGDVPISAALMIIIFAMVISFSLYLAYVQIQTTVIRNAMNKGLSNLAITISEDTYSALRESNFDEYVKKLTGSTAYRHALETRYRQDVLGTVELSNSEYKIDNLRLDFAVDGKKLTYTCTCDVTFYVALFGNKVPAAVKSVQVQGTHNAKYGR